MGCDFYRKTRLEVEYQDGRTDFIDLEIERFWFVTVEGEDNMTEEEYEECEEKFGNEKCKDDIIIYENGNFIDEKKKEKYLKKIIGINEPWLIRKGDKKMSDIKKITKIQYLQER